MSPGLSYIMQHARVSSDHLSTGHRTPRGARVEKKKFEGDIFECVYVCKSQSAAINESFLFMFLLHKSDKTDFTEMVHDV